MRLFAGLVALATFVLQLASAQQKPIVWSADEKPLADQIHGLRGLADDVRAGTTKELALKIRKLPAAENKLRLAVNLAELSTEGDFGHDALQEVATTLADALRERPLPWAEPAKSDAARPQPRACRLNHILNSPHWCATSMLRPRLMTNSIGRRWRSWRRMIASVSIRSLR